MPGKGGVEQLRAVFAENTDFTEVRLAGAERMVSMGNKDQSQGRRAAIRNILMSEWDPIGVNDTPEAADEYDGYIGDIFELLAAHASSQEIAAYLQDVETERMGLVDAQGKPMLPMKIRDAAVRSLMLLAPATPATRKLWNPFSK